MIPQHTAMELVPVEVESLVIGQILYSGDVISRAARLLKSSHFGDKRCAEIYEACLELWRQDKAVDLVTVYTELKRRGQIEPGQRAFDLAQYTNHVAQITNFEDHASIVLDHFRKRTLLTASHTILASIEGREDTTSVISRMNADIEAASIADTESDVSGAEIAYEVMNSPSPKPLYLGMKLVDDYVFVLPGNVVTVKGEPGAGKTAFVLSAILNLLPRVEVWMVSLEMSPKELMTRALCQLAEVDIADALQGDSRLHADDKARMAQAANIHAPMLGRLRIEPAESMNLDVFRSRAEHMVKNRGTGLIVLDYAQLVDADPERYRTQVLQLEAVSKTVRAVGRKMEVPVIEVVHISKDGTEHGTKQFEKDAHVRLAIEVNEKGERFVSVLKNRNGRTAFQLPLTCVMKHGIMGRETPPDWAGSIAPKPFDPRAGMPNNRTEPAKEDSEPAPF